MSFRFWLAAGLLFPLALSASDIAVNTSSKYSGSYGMRSTLSTADPAYVETDTPNAETAYNARFYTNLRCLDLAEGETVDLFQATDSMGDVWFALEAERSAGENVLNVYARENAGTYLSSGPVALSPGWRVLEAAWTSGAPGTLSVLRDGSQVANLTNIDNGNGQIDFARLGAVAGTYLANSGFISFDDFASARGSALGTVTPFTDVTSANIFAADIQALYSSGITGGCSATSFCSDNTVTRAQMAAFILRGLNRDQCVYVAPAGPLTATFGDVPTSHPFYREIEEFFSQGFTSGCGGGDYCPNAGVTRGQMAVFLLRAKFGTSYSPVSCVSQPSGFADVPTTHPFCAWIRDLADEGITGGCGGNNYCPESIVTRGQMAAFLQRTLGLPKIAP